MSFKGTISFHELYDTIEDMKKGKTKAIDRLTEYVKNGSISVNEYNKIIKENIEVYNRKKKYKSRNLIYLLSVFIVIPVVGFWTVGASICFLLLFLSYSYLTSQDIASREYELEKFSQEINLLKRTIESYKINVAFLESDLKIEKAKSKQ